jgi:hypothetical protein
MGTSVTGTLTLELMPGELFSFAQLGVAGYLVGGPARKHDAPADASMSRTAHRQGD